MYLPNLNKKLPRKGKKEISPLSLQNFQSLIDKNWRFQKVSGRSLARYHGETLDQRRISFKDRPTSNP